MQPITNPDVYIYQMQPTTNPNVCRHPITGDIATEFYQTKPQLQSQKDQILYSHHSQQYLRKNSKNFQLDLLLLTN